MKCSFCGHQFDSDEAASACEGCGLVKSCNLVACPNCGFESPPDAELPGFIRKIINIFSKKE